MFFAFSRGDAALLAAVLTISVLGLLPVWRELAWQGVSLLAWWMAGLMLLSPTLALIRLARERRGQR
jgi:hypothetical protein